MIKLYVCKICGEPYLGNNIDDCPFCGAPKSYLREAEDYSELWKTELSEQEKKDIQATLDLEVNATAYYEKVMKTQDKYSKYDRLFKQFMRVEKEHAEIASKFLNIELPEFKGEDSKGNIEEDLKRSHELENHAVELYTKFLKNATNPNVKNFFNALKHAEQGHEDFLQENL